MGPLYMGGIPDATEDVGPIDGERFYSDAQELNGKGVEVSGQVLESRFLESLGVAAILTALAGDNGNRYLGVILIPGDLSGIYPPGSDIEASGRHLGWSVVPADIFDAYPNDEGYALPHMVAWMSSGGCR